MTMTLIEGRFRILGAAPDGDSVRFYPADPESFRRLFPGVRTNHAGGAQLRLDGIDALETHYRPREGTRRIQHQRRDFSAAASDELLRFLGFSSVSRADDQIVTASHPEHTQGYVLTRHADFYGRSIAFVFSGAPAYADGSQVRIEQSMLTASANYHLLSQGLVYPSYFSKLYPDLRAAMTIAVMQARAGNKGLWPHDETITVRERAFARGRVNFVIVEPPLILAHNGFHAAHLGWHAGHVRSFHTDDVGRIKSFDGFEVFAFLAEFNEFLADFHGSHTHILHSCEVWAGSARPTLQQTLP